MPALEYIGRRGDDQVELGSGTEHRITRNWLIKTDVRFFSELQVLSLATSTGASGYVLPLPYISTHPDNAAYVCKRLRAKRSRTSPLHWEAEAEFNTAPIDTNKEEEDTPVLDRRAKFSWSTTKYQKAIEKDRDGNAILNSAGDYFDPPPLKDVSRWTVTVTKNMSALPDGILTWENKLNSDAFTIDGVSVEVNGAKISQINVGDIQKEGDTEFRVLTYSLEFDKDNWEGKYLDQGFYFLDSGTKKRIQINGKDCVSPQMLDGSGGKITNPTPATAVFMSYDIYEEMAFNGNLPLT